MPTKAARTAAENAGRERFFGTRHQAAAVPFFVSTTPALQRRCDECEAERKERVQTKLDVGEPGDELEREADRAADRVVQRQPVETVQEEPADEPRLRARFEAPQPPPEASGSGEGEDAGGGEAATSAWAGGNGNGSGGTLEGTLNARRGRGERLPPAQRTFFESELGHDFGAVRLHVDGEANGLASALHAQAFTYGNDIYFSSGRFAPDNRSGRHLLAHELTHVTQQARALRRQPVDAPASPEPAQSLTTVKPKSSRIEDVIKFYKRWPKIEIKQYYIVDKNKLKIYDAKGKHKKTFTVQRPGLVDATGYYLGSAFHEVGWVWVSETGKGTLDITALTRKGMLERKKDTRQGEALRALDEELTVIEWIDFKDVNSFWTTSGTGLTAMAVMNTPIKSTASKGTGKEGPVLRYDYPSWFKELKKRIEDRIAIDRKADPGNPNLPDRIFFYGSDGVQARRGADAWTIEVEKGKREAYLTVLKQAWDDAEDKDSYAAGVTQQLYRKIKLIIDETELEKQEQKEISEIDATGEKKKGSQWAWAIRLKKEIEALLAGQKKQNPAARDFPDKLTLATQARDGEAMAYLRVWVYKERKDATVDAMPELMGGTLPTALKEGDEASYWGPIVRKAAEALRSGRASTEGGIEGADVAKADFTTLPPYPAKIHPYDFNPDLRTATIAANTFRMVVDTSAVHGTNLLNLTTIHMGMSIGYSWQIHPLPAALEPLMTDSARGSLEHLQLQSTDYARGHADSLGVPKKTYPADFDWDQPVEMSTLGTGDFLMSSKASIAYPSDWQIKRAPSVAALPFTVMKAEDLAAQSAYAESDAIQKLKDQLARETDPDRKNLLLEQIKDLEQRETTDLLSLVRKDARETLKLIENAGKLRKFIENERKQRPRFQGSTDYDPFLVRLSDHKDLYSLYILVRQVFDFRYGDIYAVDEYTKLIRKQYEELQRLEKRTVGVTNNPKLDKGQPLYRCVAALVNEEDGNLVPLILVVGHHEDSTKDNVKMMLIDVTFDAPQGNMTYVGSTKSTEEDAVRSAFVKFGEKNQYGDGKVAYRVPQLGLQGHVDSITTLTEYLGYALAVAGIALLVAGAILSAGTLAPASAAAIGGIVTALGISAGVAGAVLAARNIHERVEKGTFEFDAEFALDVVSILGAYAQLAGTAGRLALASRTVGAAQRMMFIQRLDRLLLIYDTVELGGSVVLVGMKVKDDVAAVEALNLPKEQEEQMKRQIAMEAVQQGAMLAFASFTKVKDVSEHLQTRVANSKYASLRERGWIDEQGLPTEHAPPFLREQVTKPGKAQSRARQAEQAQIEARVFDIATQPTADREHKLTITENGRIIRCSDFCTDLRLKYGETLERDPVLNGQMADLEARARQAAKSGNKAEAEDVAAAATTFEARLKQADDLRKHLFGMTDEEIDAALESIQAGNVTGGAKSGYKIDDVRIPKRQRRQIDVADIMTDAELKALGSGGYKKALERLNNVMGKKISDIPTLKKHWDAAREHVLAGKQVTDYTPDAVIAKYKQAQRKFWENVRKDPDAVAFLKKHGFEFSGDRGAALAVLGPQGKATTERGKITNQERRISLDHIDEKAQGENWKKALDADNLELMFQNANSWKEIVQVKFGMRDKSP